MLNERQRATKWISEGCTNEEFPERWWRIVYCKSAAAIVMVRKVNDDLDIPLLSESRERRLIEKFVDKIMPKVEPSMQAIMPDVYVRCIKKALDETETIKNRRKHISTLLRGELSEPLTRQLNERVDCSGIPEKWEGKVLKLVSNKVIDEFVEWTVGEVDERLRVVPGSDRSTDVDRSMPEEESKMPEEESESVDRSL